MVVPVARNHIDGIGREIFGHDVGGIGVVVHGHEGRFENRYAIGIDGIVRIVVQADVLVAAVLFVLRCRGAGEEDFGNHQVAADFPEAHLDSDRLVIFHDRDVLG